MRSPGILVAMLFFVTGETPRSPMMDSSTASQSALFSIAAVADSGTDESSEKSSSGRLVANQYRIDRGVVGFGYSL